MPLPLLGVRLVILWVRRVANSGLALARAAAYSTEWDKKGGVGGSGTRVGGTSDTSGQIAKSSWRPETMGGFTGFD